MRRRRWPVVTIVLGVLALLTWYVAYTQQVVSDLRLAASTQVRMYSRIYRALSDTGAVAGDHTAALLDLAEHVKNSGVPLVLTDGDGNVAATANLPFDAADDDPRLRDYVRELDAKNAPILEPGLGGVHYGDTAIVDGLRIIPLLQAAGIGLLLLVGAYALMERGHARRN